MPCGVPLQVSGARGRLSLRSLGGGLRSWLAVRGTCTAALNLTAPPLLRLAALFRHLRNGGRSQPFRSTQSGSFRRDTPRRTIRWRNVPPLRGTPRYASCHREAGTDMLPPGTFLIHLRDAGEECPRPLTPLLVAEPEGEVLRPLGGLGPRAGLVRGARPARPVPAVRVVLVDDAAHQPAAHAGEFRRVEREPLVLGHLHGDRLEVGEMGGAAELLAAGADPPHHPRLVADADLAHLDAGTKFVGQVLDQLPEIDPAVRREVEDRLAPVEEELGPHELHRELSRFDPGEAIGVGVPLAPGVFLVRVEVVGGGRPDHLRERGLARVEGYVVDPLDDLPQDRTALGHHDRVVPLAERDPGAVVMARLAYAAEPDARQIHFGTYSFR